MLKGMKFRVCFDFTHGGVNVLRCCERCPPVRRFVQFGRRTPVLRSVLLVSCSVLRKVNLGGGIIGNGGQAL
jgi:hypothetical protein